MYYLIILGVLLLDQVSKWAIVSNMDRGETIPLIENVFHITYVQNTGAAFSILEGHRIFLVVMTGIMILGILIFLAIRGKKEHWGMNLALSLIIAGGVGNLLDRIFRGFVVDLFDFRVFPVFNVADISVCVGCGLLILWVIFFDRNHKERQENGKRDI